MEVTAIIAETIVTGVTAYTQSAAVTNMPNGLINDEEVIPAERNVSLAPKPDDKLNLDWRAAYNETRADRF
jgi:hypothetical protein